MAPKKKPAPIIEQTNKEVKENVETTVSKTAGNLAADTIKSLIPNDDEAEKNLPYVSVYPARPQRPPAPQAPPLP